MDPSLLSQKQDAGVEQLPPETAMSAQAGSTDEPVVDGPTPMEVDSRNDRLYNEATQLQAPTEQTRAAGTYPEFLRPSLAAESFPVPRGLSLPMANSNNEQESLSSKKHTCPYCGTEFTRLHNLKSHLLTHSQEKPYVCQSCQMRFRRLHDLKRHSKLHTGENPHICPKCDRKFARGDALARHMKGPGGCSGRRASMGSLVEDEGYEEASTAEVDYSALPSLKDELTEAINLMTTWSDTSTLLHSHFPFGLESDLGRDSKDKTMEEDRTEYSASIGISEEKTLGLKGRIEQLLRDRQRDSKVIQQLKLEKEMMKARITEFNEFLEMHGANALVTRLWEKNPVAGKDPHAIDVSELKFEEEKPSPGDDQILLEKPAEANATLGPLKSESSCAVIPQASLKASTNESPRSSWVDGQTSDTDGCFGSLQMQHCPKQVGIATIRVQLLSFSKPNVEYDSEDSASVNGDEPEDGDGSKRGETHESIGPSGGSGEPSGENGQSSRVSRNAPKRSQDAEEGNGGQDGDRRKRRRLNPPPSTKSVQRFACPYQAYEFFQPCFRQGPNNPKGGCDGIHRLKQHLNRRHNVSSRCPNCRRSFDSKKKLKDHIAEHTCQAKPKPENDRFMTVSEHEVDDCCGAESEEDIWWKLFQLLIPGMASRDLPSLKLQYYPYYVSCDMSLTIPSLTFSDLSFNQAQSSTGIAPISNTDLPESGDLLGLDSEISLHSEQTLPTMPLSHTLSVPVYVSNPQAAHATPGQLQPTGLESASIWDAQSVAPVLSSSDSQSDANVPAQFSSAQTPLTQPSTTSYTQAGNRYALTEQTQLRRNYERIKERNRRAESEIEKLHEANRVNRDEIGRADGILEELMDSENMPGEMYEKLMELSKLLESVSGRIRSN